MKTFLLKYTLAFFNFLGMKFVYDWHKNHKCKIIQDIQYGDTKEHKLDIFVPEQKDKNQNVKQNQNKDFPIIIYFHGGGLMLGDKKDAYGTCKYLSDQGYLVFNVDYRLTPKYKFPTQLQDIAEAIYWISQHAKIYGGDVEKIFLSGDSAGAYLASWYSTALYKPEMFAKTKISQVIPKGNLKGSLYFYGIFDWESAAKVRRFFNIKLMAKSLFGEKIPDISSSLKNISTKQSPIFIASSERDQVHGQSKTYAKKIKEKNIEVETLFFDRTNFPKGNHGFLGHGNSKCCKIAITNAIKFLKKHIS